MITRIPWPPCRRGEVSMITIDYNTGNRTDYWSEGNSASFYTHINYTIICSITASTYTNAAMAVVFITVPCNRDKFSLHLDSVLLTGFKGDIGLGKRVEIGTDSGGDGDVLSTEAGEG